MRLGEEERRKKPQGKHIMSASATQSGHNKSDASVYSAQSPTGSVYFLLSSRVSTLYSEYRLSMQSSTLMTAEKISLGRGRVDVLG